MVVFYLISPALCFFHPAIHLLLHDPFPFYYVKVKGLNPRFYVFFVFFMLFTLFLPRRQKNLLCNFLQFLC